MTELYPDVAGRAGVGTASARPGTCRPLSGPRATHPWKGNPYLICSVIPLPDSDMHACFRFHKTADGKPIRVRQEYRGYVWNRQAYPVPPQISAADRETLESFKIVKAKMPQRLTWVPSFAAAITTTGYSPRFAGLRIACA